MCYGNKMPAMRHHTQLEIAAIIAYLPVVGQIVRSRLWMLVSSLKPFPLSHQV